jgi:hypothetical protein
MSYCAGRSVPANGSSRTPSVRRNSSLEDINFVVRAFKKGMAEKGQSSPLDRLLDTAGQLFRRYGFQAVGIDRILVVAVWETGGQV